MFIKRKMNITILLIYDVKFYKDKRIQLENILKKYKSFKNLYPIKSKVPNIFQKYLKLGLLLIQYKKFYFL